MWARTVGCEMAIAAAPTTAAIDKELSVSCFEDATARRADGCALSLKSQLAEPEQWRPRLELAIDPAKLGPKFAGGSAAGSLTFVAPAQNLRGMLISQTLNDKINEQIGYEFAAASSIRPLHLTSTPSPSPFWRDTSTSRPNESTNMR